MTTRDTLLDLERQFWTGNAEFYRQHLDATCLIAFTEMSGNFTKADIAASIKSGDRWRDLKLDPRGLIEPMGGIAILSYRAHAVRPDGSPYDALVSSGYVRRGADWKMAFHQQTPLAADAKA